MSLIDERLERDDRVVGGKAVRSRSAGNERAFSDATRDFSREFVLVGSALSVIRFGRVGEEAAFDQHGRDGRFSQNVKTSPPHTAIGRGRAAGHVIMNGGSERSEEHTSELQSHVNLVCRLLLEKKKQN